MTSTEIEQDRDRIFLGESPRFRYWYHPSTDSVTSEGEHSGRANTAFGTLAYFQSMMLAPSFKRDLTLSRAGTPLVLGSLWVEAWAEYLVTGHFPDQVNETPVAYRDREGTPICHTCAEHAQKVYGPQHHPVSAFVPTYESTCEGCAEPLQYEARADQD